AGEGGDGWITVALPPEAIGSTREAIGAAARAAGRSFDGPGGRPYTTLLTTGCVLRPGEDPSSARVIRRVGPVAVVATHAMWESARGGHGFGMTNDDLAAKYGA